MSSTTPEDATPPVLAPDTEIEAARPAGPLDLRDRLLLATLVMSVLIVTLDNTVLNVAIPTILVDLHTDLPKLQWVITGYALTFASFLVIGGRLSDLFGARRVFMVGAAVFATGSLIAAVSSSVGMLLVGEAVIEGLGAALMAPSTLSILSRTFHGHQRNMAFAAWGATTGAAVAFGPVVGGLLTTHASWRWAFGINVVVAPLAVLGAALCIGSDPPAERRRQIDVPGAALLATTMFLVVFAISEGADLGWLRPVRDLQLAGRPSWGGSWPLSPTPVVFVLAAAALAAFVAVERRRERQQRDALIDLRQLEVRTFRYGLITSTVIAMGQLGLIFILPVFLQETLHLSAATTGLWLLPQGICIVIGAQASGRLTRRYGITTLVRWGVVLETFGLLYVAAVTRPGLTLGTGLPGFVLFGTGIGIASAQLINVILSDIAPDRSGVASATNTTFRQVGVALGIAMMGALLSVSTRRHAQDAVDASGALSAATKALARDGLGVHGVSYKPPASLPAHEAGVLARTMEAAVASGARPALLFAAAMLAAGTAVSFLIPRVGPARSPGAAEG
jgi:MFS family permease